MSEMVDDIAYLSQEIGPRPAGTEEEQQASKYIVSRFAKSAGLRADAEEFACDTQPNLIAAICFGISIVMTVVGVLASAAAIAAFIITLIAAVLYLLEFFDKPVLSRILGRGISQNVIATYNPGQAASTRRRKIVLVANYDSDKVHAELGQGLIGVYPAMQKAAFVSLIALPVVWLIRAAASGVQGIGSVVFDVIFIVLAVLAAVPVIFYFIERSASYNEAANDNAAGVAVMMEVARRINDNYEVIDEEIDEEARAEADNEAVATTDGKESAHHENVDANGVEPVHVDEPLQDDTANVQADNGSLGPQIANDGNSQEQGSVTEADGQPQVTSAQKTVSDDARQGITLEESQGQNNTDQSEGNGLLIEQAEPPEQLKQESDEELDNAKNAAIAQAREERRAAAQVPEWYRVAQQKAHRPQNDKPVKRSRYADALDAAVAESSHHFEEAAAAVTRETSQYLHAFDRGIKEVAAPSDAATRGAARPKNPSSADMMRDAKERAEAAVRERTRLDAEEDAAQERADMEEEAIARAAKEATDGVDTSRGSTEAKPVEQVQAKVVSRETVAFVDDIDSEIIDAERAANEHLAAEGDIPSENDDVIDEEPVSAESEYLDSAHPETQDAVSSEDDNEGKTERISRPATIDIKGLRAEVAAQNAASNDPVRRLQTAPTNEVVESPKESSERIVYDETEETSLPYYDEQGYTHTLENTKDRIESGFSGLKNRVKKLHLPKIHLSRSNEAAYDVENEDDAENVMYPAVDRKEYETVINSDDDDIDWEPRMDDGDDNIRSRGEQGLDATARVPSVSNGDTSGESLGENEPAEIPVVSRNAQDVSAQNTSGANYSAVAKRTAPQTIDAAETGAVQQPRRRRNAGDPNSTIGIAPIHVEPEQTGEARARRTINVPKVEATGSVPPVIDQIKQRAPLADEAERDSETAAKTLLSSRIPRINLDGTGAVNEKIEMDNKKAALRNTLPSMSGSITMMPSTDTGNNNTVSVAGSFASSAGTTGSFAPVGDELVADIPPEERYIEDADDSAYEANATETGAFAGPGYMEMPAKHRGLFNRHKKDKKSEQHQQSAAEWLDVDEDFNPTQVGAQRGGWESFQQGSAYEEQQRKRQQSKKKAASDQEYEEWDDESTWSDEWNGGAFSRSRAESQQSRTSRRRNNDEENEDVPTRRRPAETLPPEFADVARIANRIAIEQGDGTETAQDEELQDVYALRNPSVNCEVWFVGLGAENAKNAGMKAFLDAHSEELKGSIVINLEALGAGKLSYLDSEGALRTKKVSTRVKRYLRMASQATGVDVQKASIDWRESASSIAMRRGLQAVTLVGMETGKPALMAQGDDVLENIREESLHDAVDYLIAVMQNI